MPALAVLGDMLFCFLVMGLAASIITFGKFLAKFMPNLPLGIGSLLRDAVISLTVAAGGFLVDLTHGSYNRMSQLAQDMGNALIWPLRAQVSAINHIAGLVSHVNNTNLPAAQNAAERYSDNAVNSETSRAENREADLSQSITHTATALQDNITHLQDVTVPALITDAKNEVYANLAKDVTSLQDNINSLAAETTQLLAQVWDAIRPLQTAVVSTIPAELQAQAERENADIASTRAADAAALASSVSALNSEITDLSNQLRTEIATASAAAAALAAADLSTAEGVAQADAAAAQLAASQDAATALQQKAAVLQGQIDDQTRQLEQLEATTSITLPGLNNVSIPGIVSVPVAVGALAQAVAGVITEVDTCMVTTCDGPNNIANVLQKELGLFSTVGELGFIAAAIKDPVGTADALETSLGGLLNTGKETFDALLSL